MHCKLSTSASLTKIEVVIGAKASAVKGARANDGSIKPFDDEVQKRMAMFAKTLSATTAVMVASKSLNSAAGEWQKRVTGLSCDDKGDFVDLDEWYPKDTNYDDFGDELFDKGMVERRPE